jgi:hypothetical protein
MSLEARIELLTSAIIELTAAIGGMQAPGQAEVKHKVTAKDVAKNRTEGESLMGTKTRLEKEGVRNELPTPVDTTSGQQSAQTGESSSPALDYDKDVKPITLALSKAKGPETTKAILAKFDVASAKQLVAGQWADYIAACNEALA